MNNNLLIEFIDRLRKEKNISIGDFTKDIVSKRSYSRFLSYEAGISFEVLNAFLERLDMPLFELGNYIMNVTIHENVDEYYFFDAILNEKYDYAYNEIYPKIKDKKWKTLLASKTIPMGIQLVLYKMNKITKYQALDNMAKYLELDKIIKSKIVFYNDIAAFKIYLELCNDKDKEKIAEYLYKVHFNNNYKILTNTVEVTNLLIYSNILKALTSLKTQSMKIKKRIKEVLDSFLEYHKRAKMDVYDVMIFEIVYKYVKDNNIRNDLVVFHYFTALITSDNFNENEFFKNMDANDIRILLELLDNEIFVRESMYERIMSHEIL